VRRDQELKEVSPKYLLATDAGRRFMTDAELAEIQRSLKELTE
jgi:hypothetical protein